MNKNVCIIHFNTPILTAHLVKSINKYTPGCHIYIFDNSDKSPFKNTFDNVTVFDNTKGQIINFNEWLKKYPNKDKSGGKTNKWGSAKHAYSVEKCMELVKEPFVLFDSDVLVRRDFSILFDDIVCYKGEVIVQPRSKIKRVLPFICFINTPKCLKNNIHYFDEHYMHGLRVGPSGDSYDTGAALYLLTEKNKAPHREIKVADYIVHYGNGSWVAEAEKIKKPKHIPAMDWLNKYKMFWDTEEKTMKKQKTFNDLFDHIYCLHYLPDEQKLPKLKEELFRVGIDDTAEYFSWVYDYPSTLLNNIYTDLNISTELNVIGREHAKNLSLKHYEMIKEAYELGYKRILIMNDNIRFHKDLNFINKMLVNMPDTDVVMLDKMVCSKPAENLKYKQYIKTLPADALYGDMGASNVFFIFTSCYALNRKAMERIIKLQEEKLLPADTPLNDKELTGSFAITNLAIQNTENYNVIGLDSSKYNLEAKQPEKPKRVIVPAARIGTSPINKTIKRPEPGFVPKKEVAKPRTLEQVKRPVSKKAVLPDKKIPNVLTRRIPARGTNKLYEF